MRERIREVGVPEPCIDGYEDRADAWCCPARNHPLDAIRQPEPDLVTLAQAEIDEASRKIVDFRSKLAEGEPTIAMNHGRRVAIARRAPDQRVSECLVEPGKLHHLRPRG
jgi:hypothetical protein